MGLYGEMGCTMRGDFLSQAWKGLRCSDFSGTPFVTNEVPEKFEQESSMRDKEKVNDVSENLDFLENNHNLAGNTDFWARSNFNSFTNFAPSMTNNGALAL